MVDGCLYLSDYRFLGIRIFQALQGSLALRLREKKTANILGIGFQSWYGWDICKSNGKKAEYALGKG